MIELVAEDLSTGAENISVKVASVGMSAVDDPLRLSSVVPEKAFNNSNEPGSVSSCLHPESEKLKTIRQSTIPLYDIDRVRKRIPFLVSSSN